MATRLFTTVLHYMMAAASLGAALGALLMFWLGASNLFDAFWSGAVVNPLATRVITTSVMDATDAILFGVVLTTFAYALMFGFVVNAARGLASRTDWIRTGRVTELKHTLIEVIIVYMVVDFATDLVELEPEPAWQILVMPLAIILIAGALRLLGTVYPQDVPRPPQRPEGPG
jgi:uncharacterized membrane protein YqhA